MCSIRRPARDSETEAFKHFANEVLTIISNFQQRAQEAGKPSWNFSIDFSKDATKPRTLTLVQILSLLPEKYQPSLTHLNDERRGKFNTRSWMDGNLMDVLVNLHHQNKDGDEIQFGYGLESDACRSMDELFQMEHNSSALDHKCHLVRKGAPRSEWDPDGKYKILPSIKKIVYFWNYREDHWTVMESTIDNGNWNHENYNSCSTPYVFSSRTECESFYSLQALIQLASGFPATIGGVAQGKSALQTGPTDCGVVAVYNAIQLLRAEKPSTIIDTDLQRLTYLCWIRQELACQEKIVEAERTLALKNGRCETLNNMDEDDDARMLDSNSQGTLCTEEDMMEWNILKNSMKTMLNRQRRGEIAVLIQGGMKL
jgi:hypothetical protein